MYANTACVWVAASQMRWWLCCLRTYDLQHGAVLLPLLLFFGRTYPCCWLGSSYRRCQPRYIFATILKDHPCLPRPLPPPLPAPSTPPRSHAPLQAAHTAGMCILGVFAGWHLNICGIVHATLAGADLAGLFGDAPCPKGILARFRNVELATAWHLPCTTRDESG